MYEKKYMQQKISVEFGLSIAIVCVTIFGGVFWLMQRQSAIDDETAVSMNIEATSTQTPLNTTIAFELSETVSIDKWTSFGISDWSNYEIFSTGIIAITPKKNTLVHYAEEKGSPDSTRMVFGYMTIDAKNTKLWGTVSVSAFRDTIDKSSDLEQFIRAEGKTIHEDYCKQYGVDDVRYGDGVCHTDISHVRKISDTVMAWNEDFIGSPDIISVLVSDGRVINFQIGQDNSSDDDMIALIEDIAKTAQVNPVAK